MTRKHWLDDWSWHMRSARRARRAGDLGEHASHLYFAAIARLVASRFED